MTTNRSRAYETAVMEFCVQYLLGSSCRLGGRSYNRCDWIHMLIAAFAQVTRSMSQIASVRGLIAASVVGKSIKQGIPSMIVVGLGTYPA